MQLKCLDMDHEISLFCLMLSAIALNSAVTEGFVLKFWRRVSDYATYRALWTYSVKGNTNFCHPLFPLRKSCCWLPVKKGATNHSSKCTTLLQTKTPVNVKVERPDTEKAFSVTFVVILGPHKSLWKTYRREENRWPSTVCSAAAQALPPRGIWKPWRYYFNESCMCAQFLSVTSLAT